MRLFNIVFLLGFLCDSAVGNLEATYEDVILKPPTSKTGTVVVLYFGQGADIKTSQYVKIMTTLQNALTFPLWVGIPQCPENACSIPNGLSNGIARINSAMIAQGMKADKSFYGGHSLGGAMMPDYVYKSASKTASGMFLLGSFLTRKYKTGKTSQGRPQVVFPVPTLTIGAELDGLCRISRITEALYSQVTFSSDPAKASTTLPVTVISGMNHMQFASGEVPTFVKENDLKAEITEDQAQTAAVKDISVFMESIIHSSTSSYATTLKSRVSDSQKFTQPITDALLMESYEEFLPPCYCETPVCTWIYIFMYFTFIYRILYICYIYYICLLIYPNILQDEYGGLQYGTCVSTATCTGGVQWTTEYAQKVMAGLTDPRVSGLSIKSADSIHHVTEEDPSCHLPHIHGNPDDTANPGHGTTPPLCASPSKCKLDITTVTEHVYDNSGEVDIWRFHFDVPWADTGYLPISSNEMKTKLKSRQAIWEAAGLKNVSFTETDVTVTDGGKGDRCKEINQNAIDWALSKLPSKTKSRFQTYGQKLIVGADLSTCAAGPCWIWDPLRFQKDDAKNTVNVQSVWFGTQNENPYPCGEFKTIPCDAGFHYCKLLSPAKALEWMYVDGLRNKLGTNK